MAENFKEFYAAHKARLFGYLMRLTGDYENSRDIMQESFTRYFERYTGNPFSPALLFTIARNAVLDDLRRKRPQDPLDDQLCSPGATDQERHMLVRDEYRRVLTAMQQLSIDERDLLCLVISGGLAYREIARMTGLSVANLKVKIHRIRLKLRELLKMGEMK
jgi:RNA polymerase sigma-70 factor (ECF subfamily)